MSHKFKALNPKLPFVFVNVAMTADGKIASANGGIHTFGSARDLRHLYELRATADAILCGAKTVGVAGTILGNGGEKYTRLRLKRGLAEYNLRIVASGSGSLDPNATIFKKKFSPVIVLTTKRISKANFRKLAAVADEVKICGEKEINFPAALRWLRERWEVKRLLCEGGGELNSGLFRANLVDEINLTICPKILGGRYAPTLAEGPSGLTLASARRFKLVSFKPQDGELFTTFLKGKKVLSA